ncbi:hypothetical protein ABRT01_08930 [Lentibacillus sp. L22]|nr:hypothetical protein [Lentibacillus daqui]
MKHEAPHNGGASHYLVISKSSNQHVKLKTLAVIRVVVAISH